MNKLAVATASAVFLLAVPILALGAGAATTSTPMKFGMDANSITAQTNAGVKPDYATFWIGPWTLSSGWAGPDASLTNMYNAGVTPSIHYYYWGDDISVSCIENGCWSSLHNAQKDKAHWQMLAQQLVDHLNAKMGGRPVLIFLETEFNKGSVATYEPLDGYLTEKANFIKTGYPAAKIVMALGNWNSGAWGTWDRTAAASDYTGIQGMRGSTRQTLPQYRTLYEGVLSGAQTLQNTFHKPIILQDLALSTYPEPDYLQPQADEMKEFFTGMASLKAIGVEGLFYRTWQDNPNMNTANYYGEAERHWGLSWAYNGTGKPARTVWVDGVKAERSGATPPPPPPPAPSGIAVGRSGALAEAEGFAVRSTGGKVTESQASAGAAWNLWSNGYAAQAFDFAAGDYKVTIRARGSPMSGVAPHMVATLGGALLLVADPGTSYADYTATVPASAAAELRVQFTNDAKTATEDRNLIVDKVTITWVNHAPAATFAAQASGLSVAVDASGSSDPDGDALSFAWAFGDGATATGAQASHAYPAAGSYPVTVTVSDGSLTASSTQTVVVSAPNRAPVAAFVATMSGLSAAVDASASSDPDGDALTYAWAFGDGSSGAGKLASHAYAAAGQYTVTLTVSDGKVASSSSQTVTAVQPNRAPAAAFSLVMSQLSVSVDASASSDADGDVLTYAWSFGDGSTGTGKQASHAYASPGQYTVILTVSDGKASASSSKAASATAPAFTASFAASPNVNEWWVEVKVTSSSEPTKVEASVNGGAFVALTKQSWGNWAKSINAPRGSTVVFRATDAHGQSVTSQGFQWMGPAFAASFTPKTQTNKGWIEVGVSANAPLAKVEARINGGAFFVLDPTDWATYAKAVHMGKNSKVEFRATSTSGDSVTSAAYTWG